MGKRSKRNIRSISDNDDLLQGAVADDDHALALRLIEEGANVNTSTPVLRFSLLNFCGKNSAAPGAGEKMARLLISKGANINARDRQGQTPLLLAIAMKTWPIVQVLIEENADQTLPNSEGVTARMLMADPVATAAFTFYMQGVAAQAQAVGIGGVMAVPQGQNKKKGVL